MTSAQALTAPVSPGMVGLGRPSFSRVVQRGKRDCLRCCVAMVTGMPYEAVPDFVADFGAGWKRPLRDWLAERGLALVRLGLDVAELPDGRPQIVLRRTDSWFAHAVVFVGGKVLDPDPQERGLTGEIRQRLAILPL